MSEQDGSSDGIYFQRANTSLGKIGVETRANTYTTNSQDISQIAPLSDTGYVIVWESDGQDGSDYGVYGQVFDTTGAKVGTEFRANTYTSSRQWLPRVAGAPDGTFVVVWASWGQDGSSDGVYAQRYDATGAKIGSEFRVSSRTSGNQRSPRAAYFADGSFIIAYSSENVDGSGTAVLARKYSSDGLQDGGEFTVNTTTAGDQGYPRVAVFDDKSFVVIWMNNTSSLGYDVFGQVFNADGTRLGSEFPVNTFTSGNQMLPTVSTFSDGTFIVAWTSEAQDGSGLGVFALRFNHDGSKKYR